MTKQEAYSKGYETGKQVYSERPNMDSLAQLSWAGTEATREDIPMSRNRDYQDGFIAGYTTQRGK